ncbi:sugar nucleotide-binding protein, partial [Microbacterium sp. ARD31]|uniref:sugar nucleotide-binding protein n=1 Tax=Microbacterium sp. ARD31 TaxID=2962576 RepID=UPI0028816913
GHNFVRTMTTLAARGINPHVVDDQTGRPTFTTDLAAGIHHLTRTHAPHGTYNLTNTGPPTTWADLARTIYHLTGHDPHRITPTTTHDYYADTTHPVAPRPTNSVLDLTKICVTGFTPTDHTRALQTYLSPR